MASRSRTELAVLGLLAQAGTASGYDLRRHVERSVGFIWTPTRSQLYAVLPRLVDAGLVEAEHVPQADRPDKRLHAITDAGRAVVREWLTTVAAIEPEDRDGLLLKVFFAAQAPPGALRAQLLDFRARSEGRLAEYAAIAGRDIAAPERQALDLGIALVRAGLGWVDEVLDAHPPPP